MRRLKEAYGELMGNLKTDDGDENGLKQVQLALLVIIRRKLAIMHLQIDYCYYLAIVWI